MQNADIKPEDEIKKKNFLVIGLLGCSFVWWLLQSAIGGFFYATAAFFTKEGWEKWKSGRRD
ncbi:hypothetical protein EBT16_00020 [bacterium]|nr:hypothetical protein [bacterium]